MRWPFKVLHMRRCLLLVLLAASSAASAIVIRDDVDDAEYRVPACYFPALVDMPGEGHGVLIAPRWVITAAHVLPQHAQPWQVVVGGIPREVARAVVHPGYKALPQALIDQATASGEAMLIVAFLSASDDIALVELIEPVTDVVPVARHEGELQPGRIGKLIGKGATGNGADGYPLGSATRTQLRRAYNQITSAYDRWTCYRFDAPPSALALEGALGNGDSGGPLLIEVGDQWQLSGLASWKVVHGHVLTAQYGRYDQITCNVRVGHYSEWIEHVLSGSSQGGG